jgi:hypothetical protein
MYERTVLIGASLTQDTYRAGAALHKFSTPQNIGWLVT